MTDSRGFWDVVLMEGTDMAGWPAGMQWVGFISFVIGVIYFGFTFEGVVYAMLAALGSCGVVAIFFILVIIVLEMRGGSK
jgi:hypothetical protein